jgi:hypothetical protein
MNDARGWERRGTALQRQRNASVNSPERDALQGVRRPCQTRLGTPTDRAALFYAGALPKARIQKSAPGEEPATLQVYRALQHHIRQRPIETLRAAQIWLSGYCLV